MKVTKAIIAAAGLGTRFLPQTKAMPKEMLPIVDRPVIQLIVEEAVAAGVEDIIIVTGSTKRAIEDHFDRAIELEHELEEQGKVKSVAKIRDIAEIANFVYVRQKGEPKGNARPVLNVAHLLSDEPFFVFFADDFFRGSVPRAVQLKEQFDKTGKTTLAAIEVDRQDADKYGMVDPGEQVNEKLVKVTRLVEKPGFENTPSNLASVGGYLLTPDILPIIAQEKVSERGEIELSQSINELAQTDEVYACKIDGTYHDAGNPEQYLRAVVDSALADERFAKDFEAYLRQRL